MQDIEVWRTAHHLMKRYGDEAGARAAKRAGAFQAAGDTQSATVWQRIVAAIDELEREKPTAGEPGT